MNGPLQFGINIGAHFLAPGAEGLSVCQLHGRVETTPEDDAGHKAAHRQKRQAEIGTGPPQRVPDAFELLDRSAATRTRTCQNT